MNWGHGDEAVESGRHLDQGDMSKRKKRLPTDREAQNGVVMTLSWSDSRVGSGLFGDEAMSRIKRGG